MLSAVVSGLLCLKKCTNFEMV